MLNETLGPYRLVRTLRVGSHREVFLATTAASGTVVIERILPGFEDHPPMAARVSRATLAYTRLSHPAVVRMIDFITEETSPALVLEDVEGVALDTLVARLREQNEVLALSAALYVGARLFSAIAAAHSARDPVSEVPTPIVHRDLAPTNVIVSREGVVKIGGWGFGEVVGRGDDTSPGGTLGYLAPEQLTGSAVSVRTDVYAGALVVRELVTRSPAFPRSADVSPIEYLEGMARPSLPPVADVCPWVPVDIAFALTRALASDPEERSITAAQMRDLLTRSVDAEEGRRALADAAARALPTPISGVPVQILS